MTTEEQHIEELLKPRYKVTSDWPCIGNKPHVGSVIGREFFLNNENVLPFYADNYPNLFREMEWWEDRKPEDMPLYVSYKFMEDSKSKWLKVKQHFKNSFGEANKYGFIANKDYYSYSKSLPATESEYLTYQSKQ